MPKLKRGSQAKQISRSCHILQDQRSALSPLSRARSRKLLPCGPRSSRLSKVTVSSPVSNLKLNDKVIRKEGMRRMRKTGKTLRLSLVAGLLLTWCAVVTAQDIRFNYLQGTDFSKYKTYKWVRVPNAQYPNQILDDQIMQAVDA